MPSGRNSIKRAAGKMFAEVLETDRIATYAILLSNCGTQRGEPGSGASFPKQNA